VKWCYAQEYRVSDVEEAIGLAEKFRWLTKPWPPHSTLARAHKSEEAEVERAVTRLRGLESLMKSSPELQQIAEDEKAFYAVAQYYGIPTARANLDALGWRLSEPEFDAIDRASTKS